MEKLKLVILTSKDSWLYKKRKKFITNKLKKFSSKIKIITNHKNLKKSYQCLLILSYFKIIPKRYLNLSNYNLVVHESDLPKGRGFSPLFWQILNGKKVITSTILEANEKMDEGNYYFKKKFYYPPYFFFSEIKQMQLENAIILIKKVISKILNGKKIPTYKQKGRPTYFRRRVKEDSEINKNLSLKKQINLLRIIDNENWPGFIKNEGKKIYLYIKKIN